jgi:hypothetical protein
MISGTPDSKQEILDVSHTNYQLAKDDDAYTKIIYKVAQSGPIRLESEVVEAKPNEKELDQRIFQ